MNRHERRATAARLASVPDGAPPAPPVDAQVQQLAHLLTTLVLRAGRVRLSRSELMATNGTRLNVRQDEHGTVTLEVVPAPQPQPAPEPVPAPQPGPLPPPPDPRPPSPPSPPSLILASG